MDNGILMLSVIVPMFNVEKYIEQCVLSIENQIFKDIEIILVDDGSKDNTYLVADKLKSKYNNIILIKQENRGQASARNIGLSHAKGKYISFIDSDDFIEPDMFSTMIEMAEKYNLDIAECCYDDYYSNNNKVGRKYFIDADPQKIYKGREFYELKASLSPCDKIYSHRFLDKISFHCTEGHYAEDVFDSSYAILSAERIMHINKVYYHYRRDNLNSTRNNTDINRRIKLGKDKIYIAKKMDMLKENMNASGYINTIIARNLIGAKLSPIYFRNRNYRKEINRYYKENDGSMIVKKNINLKIVFELFIVGVNKIIKKGD